MTTPRIGELLVSEGLLSEASVNRALGFQRLSSERIKLGSILLNWDLLDEKDLLSTLAKLYHRPAVSWAMLSAAKIEVVRLLPAAHAIRLAAIPYAADSGSIQVAFLNPTDLLATDEIAAITGRRRVIEGVTTEVRLMQAHQRFYGRHIPLDFRTILQKLDRNSERRVVAPSQGGPDLHGRDHPPPGSATNVAAAPASRALPNSPFIRRPESRASHFIPIKPEISERDFVAAPPEIPAIVVPDIPLPKKPESPRSAPPVPTGSRPPESNPAAGSIDRLPSEDSLAEWVGDALSAFRGDRVSTSAPNRPHPPTHPKHEASETAKPREYPVSGMWRSSSLDEHPDAKVSAGWRSSGAESDSSVWEARSLQEMGDAVLENLLTDIPRVLLFGLGRTMIRGWRGRVSSLLPEQIAAIRFPLAERSVFAQVAESGVPHFGPLEAGVWPRVLKALLGADPPHCAIFPIRVLDGVAALLYADRLGEPMHYEDFAVIARATASAVNILSRFLLRQGSSTPVG